MIKFSGGYVKTNRDTFEPFLAALSHKKIGIIETRVYWGLWLLHAQIGKKVGNATAGEVMRLAQINKKPWQIRKAMWKLRELGLVGEDYSPYESQEAARGYITVPRRAIYYLARSTFKTDSFVVLHFFKFMQAKGGETRARLSRPWLASVYRISERAIDHSINRLLHEGMIKVENRFTNWNKWLVQKYGTAFQICTKWLPNAVAKGAKIAARIKSKLLTAKTRVGGMAKNEFRKAIRDRWRRWKKLGLGNWRNETKYDGIDLGSVFETRWTVEGRQEVRIDGEVYTEPPVWFVRDLLKGD